MGFLPFGNQNLGVLNQRMMNVQGSRSGSSGFYGGLSNPLLYDSYLQQMMMNSNLQFPGNQLNFPTRLGYGGFNPTGLVGNFRKSFPFINPRGGNSRYRTSFKSNNLIR